jgi:hypothetical protein
MASTVRHTSQVLSLPPSLPTHDTPDSRNRLVTVSSSDLNFDGSRRQLIYIFEGADAPSGSVGPPINLEFRQTIIPRFETPNGCIVGLCTYSKGTSSAPLRPCLVNSHHSSDGPPRLVLY